jgi:hypothetical protein
MTVGSDSETKHPPTLRKYGTADDTAQNMIRRFLVPWDDIFDQSMHFMTSLLKETRDIHIRGVDIFNFSMPCRDPAIFGGTHTE